MEASRPAAGGRREVPGAVFAAGVRPGSHPAPRVLPDELWISQRGFAPTLMDVSQLFLDPGSLVVLISDCNSPCCLQLLFFHLCFRSDVFQKSQDLLVDELSRCSLLSLNLFNFHPGSSLGSITADQCCEKIAGAINYAHQQTAAVVTGAWLV